MRLFLQAERYQDAQQELEGVIADFPDQKQICARRGAGPAAVARPQHRQGDRSPPHGRPALPGLQPARQVSHQGRGRRNAAASSRDAGRVPGTAQTARPRGDRARGPITATLPTPATAGPVRSARQGDDRRNEHGQLRSPGRLPAAERRQEPWPRAEAVAGPQRLAVGQRLGRHQPAGHAVAGPGPRLDPAVHERAGAAQAQRDRSSSCACMEGAARAAGGQADRAHEAPPGNARALGRDARLSTSCRCRSASTTKPDVTYHVQLPPEYDPYVRYPTIVTLNGAGTTPEQPDRLVGRRSRRERATAWARPRGSATS